MTNEWKLIAESISRVIGKQIRHETKKQTQNLSPELGTFQGGNKVKLDNFPEEIEVLGIKSVKTSEHEETIKPGDRVLVAPSNQGTAWTMIGKVV